MHKEIDPAILYFGTPVVLISTLNEDGTVNVAPMSSVWWLGWSCMIGLDASSKTVENILRTQECVLNLVSDELVPFVDRLAKSTGQKQVPLHKKALGYRHVSDKLSEAGFTIMPSASVSVPRLRECPIHLEAKLCHTHPFAQNSEKMTIPSVAFELEIRKVHAQESLLLDINKPYIDPDAWRPLIMNFRKFYSTGSYIHPSRLAQGPENQYAPWKRKGWRRRLLEWLLKKNTKRFGDAIAQSEQSK